MAVTKCKQTNENILRMAKNAFPEKFASEETCDCECKAQSEVQIEELTEGMCNAAYKLTFADGFKTILKIASPIKSGFLTNEINLMDAEVQAMRLVADKMQESDFVKVAQVYTYDTSKTLCEGDYFFMECLEGVNWIRFYDDLEAERPELKRQVGKIQRQLTAITNQKFGMLGDTEHVFDSLFEFVFYMIKNVLQDAAKKDVEIGVPAAEILTLLAADKPYFDLVTTATLVHWDMWEGNIFVEGGNIVGVIDWERAMWAEPLMDEPFRYHKRCQDMLDGFLPEGRKELSEAEMRRIYWYDVLLDLTMMTEVFYREYEEDGQYYWAKSLFDQVWAKI